MFDRIRSKLQRLRQAPPEQALCILPWVHLHAKVDGTVSPCCVAEEAEQFGTLHDTPVEELFNSEPMRALRRDMLAGVRNPVCERCYNLEDAGGHSLRKIFNRDLARHADAIQATAGDGAADPERIIYLDVRFSNLCNLRCRSCGPDASTAWYQDRPSDAPSDFRIIRAGATPEALWSQIEPYLPRVEVMHFAGGEPLMMDETYQTIERLLELGRTDVTLTYNTNVTTWTHRKWNALELWKRFDTVKIMASLDGAGERGEYIRKGLDWQKAVDNCVRLRRECPQAHFQINCTIGLMNALHLLDFLDACVAEGFAEPDDLYVNFIQEPRYMAMTSLPRAYKRRVRELYTERINRIGAGSPLGFRLAEALRYMDSSDTSDRLPELRQRMNELDELRRESFGRTFPELAPLMEPQ